MDPLKISFLFNMGIFHCYVSLPEGNISNTYPNSTQHTVHQHPFFCFLPSSMPGHDWKSCAMPSAPESSMLFLKSFLWKTRMFGVEEMAFLQEKAFLETNTAPEKMPVGRRFSYWNDPFSGDMFIFGGVSSSVWWGCLVHFLGKWHLLVEKFYPKTKHLQVILSCVWCPLLNLHIQQGLPSPFNHPSAS